MLRVGQFEQMLDQLATHLHCSVDCVRQCSSWYNIMDEKAGCLDVCGCYEMAELQQEAQALQFQQQAANQFAFHQSSESVSMVPLVCIFVAIAALAAAFFLNKQEKKQFVSADDEACSTHYTLLKQ